MSEPVRIGPVEHGNGSSWYWTRCKACGHPVTYVLRHGSAYATCITQDDVCCSMGCAALVVRRQLMDMGG